MVQKFVFALFVLIVCSSPSLAGDELPIWMRDAAARKPETYDKKVPAVVLVDESTVTVGEDGRTTTVATYAVRILNREGRHEAIARESYATDTGKVKEFKAWLIRPSGAVKKYGKDETLDSIADADDVYDETRLKTISAGNDAEPGSVFGYQTTTESRPFFNQSIWYFQGTLPVLSSRLTVVVPGSWRASAVTFNHDEVTPTVNGNSYTWEVQNLPFIEDEPGMPGSTSVQPRLAVKYGPADDAAHGIGLGDYKKWSDVSSWYTDLSDPQVTLDDNIAVKARELTANAKTEFEKIQAIGQYVQKIHYISIQIGVGRFRPHAATQVFAKSYGDCKDKANLMRAMLKALHITAYPVLIFSGDRDHVREEWVSPGQFNHCIVAIKVSGETQAPTIITLPELGRLLIFDATDEDTPVGDLPDHEQGSWAVVAAGNLGNLVRMPITPPESNRMDRQTEVTLQPDGSISSTVSESSTGQTAVKERRWLKHLSKPDYDKMIEGWIGHGAMGAKLSKVTPTDSPVAGNFNLNVEFSASNYAQLMQGRLLVFKPAITNRVNHLEFTDAKRKYPIALNAVSFTEMVRIKLPTGFEVDETPDGVKIDTSFGSYSAKFEVSDGNLVFTRSLVQKSGIIPPEQYTALRAFYGRIRATEQAPVVLAKK